MSRVMALKFDGTFLSKNHCWDSIASRPSCTLTAARCSSPVLVFETLPPLDRVSRGVGLDLSNTI